MIGERFLRSASLSLICSDYGKAIPTERFAIAYLFGLWESDRYRIYSQCFYYIISKGYRFSVGVLIMRLTKFAVGVCRG